MANSRFDELILLVYFQKGIRAVWTRKLIV